MYIPDQGDIIQLNFDPSSGTEIQKRRPAFVISRRLLNEHTNLALVAPITSTVRGIRLEIPLPEGMQTHGCILVYQMRSFDFQARRASFVEKAPLDITEAVYEQAKLIIS